MQKTLIELGFTDKDSQVYVFLATEGPKKAKDITEALNLHSSQLYYTLKKLQSINMVNGSSEHPARFSAVIFEKVLELLIETKKEQHKSLSARKEELLSNWRSITEKDDDES